MARLGILAARASLVNLLLVAVGRLKDGPERALCARYAERIAPLGRGLGFKLEIVERPESRATRADDRKREEGTDLLKRIGSSPVLAFDERGAAETSEAFAKRLATMRDGGAGAVALVIGGPDGLDPALCERASVVLSLGAMTLPHGLVRVLVLEQIYRATTLLSGHPYHRA